MKSNLMKYFIGAAIMLLLLAIPVVVTEQGRSTASCIISASTDPEFSSLEWEWCMWAFHDVDDTHNDMDVVQFELMKILDPAWKD